MDIIWSPNHDDRFVTFGTDLNLYKVEPIKDGVIKPQGKIHTKQEASSLTLVANYRLLYCSRHGQHGQKHATNSRTHNDSCNENEAKRSFFNKEKQISSSFGCHGILFSKLLTFLHIIPKESL